MVRATHTSLSLTTAAPATIKADALIVGIHASDEGPFLLQEPSPLSPWEDIAEAAALAGLTGRVGDVATLPGGAWVTADRLVLVGLGEPDKLDAERVRKAAGVSARAVAGLDTVASTLSAVDLTAAAEGHLLGGYQFEGYKTATKAPVRSIRLLVPSAAKAAKEQLRRAQITAEAVALARDLINTAPADLPPAVFADRASAAAQTAGLKVEVLDEKALTKGGYGGILAVGSGSTRPPRLVRISYRPRRPKASGALVGTGITFDSGGLSLKPGPGMEHMTSDMAGAAAVVATVIAAAALELPLVVTATVPLAENMPSGSAYRPADVLTHYAP
jgi:leucyl aminopeptidase